MYIATYMMKKLAQETSDINDIAPVQQETPTASSCCQKGVLVISFDSKLLKYVVVVVLHVIPHLYRLLLLHNSKYNSSTFSAQIWIISKFKALHVVLSDI